MLSHELVARKRDGGRHSEEELNFLIKGFARGQIDEALMSAWLMAVFLRGLDADETIYLTRAMINSGTVIDLSRVGGSLVDKHSTGGVGDKTTLVAGPLAAAVGVKVPKLSGRALGHTGGTLDKLAAIPGIRTYLYREEFIGQLAEVGIAIAAQTADIVPADKKLYELRDRTATVESIPLIVASILSKKAAGGAKNILIDVKVGTGAFMPDFEQARALADGLMGSGRALGLNVKCLFTDMNQPLGRAVGNALEVREAIDTLAGAGPPDLREVAVTLAAEMLLMSGELTDENGARAEVEAALNSGRALDVFGRMIKAQGGDSRVINDHTFLPTAPRVHTVKAERDGFVVIKDCRKLGLAAAILIGHRGGAVRNDAAAGLRMRARHGEKKTAGDDLVDIHYVDADRRAEAESLIGEAISLTADKPGGWPLVYRSDE